jgi:YwiC-like protein
MNSNSQAWYRPTVSHEHGVYVVLAVSFLTGAAAAYQWTWATTLALLCAFLGFQAEHPLVLQLKQRRSIKPRFLVWGGFYSGLSLAIALYLWLTQEQLASPLLGIYLGAIAAFGVDVISVLHREQKSAVNEFITFAAVCLSAPFAYIATTGTISLPLVGLWILNTLFFSSTIFTVKFRKIKTSTLWPSAIYHAIATVIIIGLYSMGLLSLLAALAFGIVLLKFCIIALFQTWYRTTEIKFVAMLETNAALLFLAIAALGAGG